MYWQQGDESEKTFLIRNFKEALQQYDPVISGYFAEVPSVNSRVPLRIHYDGVKRIIWAGDAPKVEITSEEFVELFTLAKTEFYKTI